MYSRLYSRVLCLYSWFDSAMAANLSFQDGGVFVLQASVPPERLPQMLSVLVSELLVVTHSVDATELARARTQLKSSLMMNLESRMILMEDIGRCVCGGGSRGTSASHSMPLWCGLFAMHHIPLTEALVPFPSPPQSTNVVRNTAVCR